MSPVRSDDPLVKVTLNLYTADHLLLQSRYGHGWSAVVRAAVHEYLTRTATIDSMVAKRLSEDIPCILCDNTTRCSAEGCLANKQLRGEA